MNFLAHLLLAGDSEPLRLGAMLGDFVRGSADLEPFSPGIRDGIRLHRHIDAQTDALDEIVTLRSWFAPPFRRYAGIIIDLALDHELARNWHHHSPIALERFDRDVRDMLARHDEIIPERLRRFMDYADRRGLFAAYRDENEILHSLRGIGRRLTRPNPLHRVGEIWSDFEPLAAANFAAVFLQIQSEVAEWLKSKSNTTGS